MANTSLRKRVYSAQGCRVMVDKTWSDFVAGMDLKEIKIGAIHGSGFQLGPESDLPDKWDVNLRYASRVVGEELWVRVDIDAEGPGGELTVAALGVFTSRTHDLDDEELSDLVVRFSFQTGVPAVIPTARATFDDVNMRLGLGAPRIGLVKINIEGAPESSEDDGAP